MVDIFDVYFDEDIKINDTTTIKAKKFIPAYIDTKNNRYVLLYQCQEFYIEDANNVEVHKRINTREGTIVECVRCILMEKFNKLNTLMDSSMQVSLNTAISIIGIIDDIKETLVSLNDLSESINEKDDEIVRLKQRIRELENKNKMNVQIEDDLK